MKKYTVKETVIRKEDVADFDACYVTNSLMGIMPVIQLGETEWAPLADPFKAL